MCLSSLHVLLFFFFSSRRRHTRCSRDWSSDVCSSDLDKFRAAAQDADLFPHQVAEFLERRRGLLLLRGLGGIGDRSEERREGKSVDLGGRRIIKKKRRAEGEYDCMEHILGHVRLVDSG